MQTIKLGQVGFETTLPTESRAFSSEENVLIAQEGRSANGTLHTDYIANKQTFVIQYAVLSEANKNLIKSIYQYQLGGNYLSFKYTDGDDIEIPTTVRMQAPIFGPIVIKDVYYYNGVSIVLEEV